MRHVALLIETSRSYGRGLLRGVRRYVTEHGPWSMFVEQRALDSSPPPWLRQWQGDGILARTGSPAMAKAIIATGVPTVEMRSVRYGQPFPFVGVDNRRLGEMVAEHLLERGFRHFGVYGTNVEEYYEKRCNNFVDAITQAGYDIAVFNTGRRSEKPRDWERQQRDLTEWVAALPKPAGVMACTDQYAFWLLDACKRAALSVPEEVAVVGVDDDETFCSMCSPPLSSVRLNTPQIGYAATELLDRMMAGEEPPAEILVAPLHVVTRQSSDSVAIDDPEVAAAVRLIRERACDGLTMADLLREIPVSRSTLERRMQEIIGRTPAAEITRIRLNRVKRLLEETPLSLAVIAHRCGFEHPQYMSSLFKKTFAETPGEYRKRAGG